MIPSTERRLVLESPAAIDEGATFVWDGETLSISVAQDTAIDSYNEMIECCLTASLDQARQLKDWLNKVIP